MATITDQITNAANATAKLQAQEPRVTGIASANLTSTEFLNLMMKQLQFQDPMEPQGNSEFVSQQCQFAQLQQTTNMNNTLAQSTTISQGLSLIGKDVALKNPDDTTKIITGKVDAVYIDGKETAITVNGKNYPMSYLMYAYQDTSSTTN